MKETKDREFIRNLAKQLRNDEGKTYQAIADYFLETYGLKYSRQAIFNMCNKADEKVNRKLANVLEYRDFIMYLKCFGYSAHGIEVAMREVGLHYTEYMISKVLEDISLEELAKREEDIIKGITYKIDEHCKYEDIREFCKYEFIGRDGRARVYNIKPKYFKEKYVESYARAMRLKLSSESALVYEVCRDKDTVREIYSRVGIDLGISELNLAIKMNKRG